MTEEWFRDLGSTDFPPGIQRVCFPRICVRHLGFRGPLFPASLFLVSDSAWKINSAYCQFEIKSFMELLALHCIRPIGLSSALAILSDGGVGSEKDSDSSKKVLEYDK